MRLEKIIKGIKKAACITLATIALASGSAKATDEYEIIRLSNFRSCPACRWNSHSRGRSHSLSYGLLSVNISL